MKIWILTQEFNMYDQMGEYFVAAFKEKPDHVTLAKWGVEQGRLEHVLNGGGRQGYDHDWYFLREEEIE